MARRGTVRTRPGRVPAPDARSGPGPRHQEGQGGMMSSVPPGRHRNWCKCPDCRRNIAEFEAGQFRFTLVLIAIAVVIAVIVAVVKAVA